MFDSVVQWFVDSLAACFSWFDSILSSMGSAADFVFAAIVIFLVSKFLLGPLIGGISRGSDRAKKSSKEDGDE